MTAEHRDESLGWPLTPEREPPVRPTAGLPHGSRLERCVCVLSVRWPDSVRESEFTPRPVVKQRAAVQEVPADQRKDCRCGGGHADHLHRDPLGNRTEAADRHLNLGHRRRAKATSGAWPPDPDRARCLCQDRPTATPRSITGPSVPIITVMWGIRAQSGQADRSAREQEFA